MCARFFFFTFLKLFFAMETLTQSNIYLVKAYCYTFSMRIDCDTEEKKKHDFNHSKTCLCVMICFFFCKICKNFERTMIINFVIQYCKYQGKNVNSFFGRDSVHSTTVARQAKYFMTSIQFGFYSYISSFRWMSFSVSTIHEILNYA